MVRGVKECPASVTSEQVLSQFPIPLQVGGSVSVSLEEAGCLRRTWSL